MMTDVYMSDITDDRVRCAIELLKKWVSLDPSIKVVDITFTVYSPTDDVNIVLHR